MTLVVKIGGGKQVNIPLVCQDVRDLVSGGHQIILVHGGSETANEISQKLGKPPRFVTSVSGYESRYTDRETLGILEMVYAGKINKEIVECLQGLGINAIGLTGLDGRIWVGRRKSAIKIIENGKTKVLRDDYTGVVEQVNTELLKMLLQTGYTPVLTLPALSHEGEAMNVDCDRAAAVVAAAMKAEKLIILSNVPGLLRNPEDESSLIRVIKNEMDEAMELAKGRMKKKVLGAMEALQNGVGQVIFGDARIENPIRKALEGMGTVIG
ncbi:MAG: [LysW]-aminoadipate kinase [candidate division KSB1 bacterium]|nr:[LysW]-aminoadipate kinase [candidate division KSB1 bacterium]